MSNNLLFRCSSLAVHGIRTAHTKMMKSWLSIYVAIRLLWQSFTCSVNSTETRMMMIQRDAECLQLPLTRRSGLDSVNWPCYASTPPNPDLNLFQLLKGLPASQSSSKLPNPPSPATNTSAPHPQQNLPCRYTEPSLSPAAHLFQTGEGGD